MRNRTDTNRRSFVACCVCAGCAGLARGAQPSSRNAKSLKAPATPDLPATADRPGAKKSFDIAYCGIYCAACELHLKGKKDGKKCKGCTHPSMESKCAVFNCAKEKKAANCGLCESFESCEKLLKHHEQPLYRQAARRTCAKIKADGMESAAAELKTRWTCKACGKLFPWNTSGTCPHCDKAVDALSEKDAS
jgi:hypothetical protein